MNEETTIEVSITPEVYALSARRLDATGKEVGRQAFTLTISTGKLTANLAQYRELTPEYMKTLGEALVAVSAEADKLLASIKNNQ